MALWERRDYFKTATLGTNTELDYLTTNLHKMNLRSIEFFIVDAATEHRPDLISLKFYGNYNMGWLIGFHNDIEDMIGGFPIGTKLGIPSIEEYYRFNNRNTRARDGRI